MSRNPLKRNWHTWWISLQCACHTLNKTSWLLELTDVRLLKSETEQGQIKAFPKTDFSWAPASTLLSFVLSAFTSLFNMSTLAMDVTASWLVLALVACQWRQSDASVTPRVLQNTKRAGTGCGGLNVMELYRRTGRQGATLNHWYR